jgi:hypothetical protein
VLQAAASPVSDLTFTDADPDGQRRWGAWAEGRKGETRVHLGLFARQPGSATLQWSQSWKDAYDPSLRSAPEWRYRGQPVLALTLRFGAAAQQVDLFGLDADQPPQLLAEKDAAAIGWIVSADGRLLLALYDANPTALTPGCFGWREQSGELAAEKCP